MTHSTNLAIQLTSVEERLASRQSQVERLEQALMVADTQLKSLHEALVAAAQGAVKKHNKKRSKTVVDILSSNDAIDENIDVHANKTNVDENSSNFRMRQPLADVQKVF